MAPINFTSAFERCYTNQGLHTLALAQTRFYAIQLWHNPVHTQISLYADFTLCTNLVFAQSNFYTHTHTHLFLHQLPFAKASFTPTNFHTNYLLHKLVVAQTGYYTNQFQHKLVCTQSSSYTSPFCHKMFYTYLFVRQLVYSQASFCTNYFLHNSHQRLNQKRLDQQGQDCSLFYKLPLAHIH